VFQSLREDEWARPGDHEETLHLGRVETAESVLRTLVPHTSQHLEQLRDSAGAVR
jgi:hypothetical protein